MIHSLRTTGALLMLALALAAPVFAADKPKVAVLPLNPGPGVDPKLANLITENLVTELNDLGIQVTSAQELQAAIGFERQRQLMGCTEESSCLAEIGGALGVDHLITGTLGKVGKSLVFNVQLVNMRTSLTDRRFSKRIRGRSEEVFLDVVEEAARVLFPEQAKSKKPKASPVEEDPPPPPIEPPPPPPAVSVREQPAPAPPPPTREPPPAEVVASAPAPAVERPFSLTSRVQLSPLQIGGRLDPGSRTSGAVGLLAGYSVTPTLTVSAGALASAVTAGGVTRVAWIAFDTRSNLHPVLAGELSLLFPVRHAGLPPAFGLSINPGVEYLALPWLALGLEVPLTWLITRPDGRAPSLWLFAATTVGARF